MGYKGYCLWADDIPDPEAPHYIVIVSDKNEDDYVLVVAISSVKYRLDGTEKYYDKSCVLEINEIKQDDGSYLLNRKSFIRYEYAQEVKQSFLTKWQFENKYRYKAKISDELLIRIQNGAKVSKELEPRFRKFFDFF